MQYAILCYHSEDVVCSWSKEEDDAVMAKLAVVQDRLAKAGKLGPGRPPDADDGRDHAAEGPGSAPGYRRPLRRDQGAAARLLRRRLRDARGGDRGCARTSPAPTPAGPTRSGRSRSSSPGAPRRDRPRLDRCDADLRAPAGGRRRCCAISAISTRPKRRSRKPACGRSRPGRRTVRRAIPLPGSSWSGATSRSTRRGAAASRSRCPPTRSSRISTTPKPSWPSGSTTAHYRDDILRLLFICCHPDLPATQQIALALRVVSGLSVKEIARAFLVERERHGAAHHPGQAPGRGGRGPVRDAGRGRSARSGSPPSPP